MRKVPPMDFTIMWYHNLKLAPKRKCRHLDVIFVNGCTEICENDSFRHKFLFHWDVNYISSLSRRRHYFDGIFVTYCSESFQNDNFRCSSRQKYHQMRVLSKGYSPTQIFAIGCTRSCQHVNFRVAIDENFVKKQCHMAAVFPSVAISQSESVIMHVYNSALDGWVRLPVKGWWITRVAIRRRNLWAAGFPFTAEKHGIFHGIYSRCYTYWIHLTTGLAGHKKQWPLTDCGLVESYDDIDLGQH